MLEQMRSKRSHISVICKVAGFETGRAGCEQDLFRRVLVTCYVGSRRWLNSLR